MKKKALSIISLVCMAFTALGLSAQTTDSISLQVGYIDPTKELGTHKSPIMPPIVYLDDYILFFDTPCDGCTVNVVDGSGVVVYTTVIPSGTTSLVLPATLSGEYELQIISGNYCFWGIITL
ncbi:MAG: DUF3244 domain-containing protein [Prevotella sp.]|nr:DUF3244 domain-containing protein [Prevotella sp.]